MPRCPDESQRQRTVPLHARCETGPVGTVGGATANRHPLPRQQQQPGSRSESWSRSLFVLLAAMRGVCRRLAHHETLMGPGTAEPMQSLCVVTSGLLDSHPKFTAPCLTYGRHASTRDNAKFREREVALNVDLMSHRDARHRTGPRDRLRLRTP